MKKKVIAIISILILACVTILTFTTKSEGFTQYQNGLTWYNTNKIRRLSSN